MALDLSGIRDPRGASVADDAQILREALATVRRLIGGREVTALPSSPFDGQEVYYVADSGAGVEWHLRYDKATAKWRFLGGAALYDEDGGTETTFSGAGAWVNAPTNQTELTLALAGVYDVSATCQMQANGTAGTGAMGVAITAGGTPGSPESTGQSFAANDYGSLAAAGRLTVTAGQVVRIRYQVAHTGWNIAHRALFARPVLIG